MLDGCARTAEAIRRAIQRRRGSGGALAKRSGVSPTTIQKRRGRQPAADAAMGPKEPRSTVLTLPVPQTAMRAASDPLTREIFATANRRRVQGRHWTGA